jgi:ribosomal protein L17
MIRKILNSPINPKQTILIGLKDCNTFEKHKSIEKMIMLAKRSNVKYFEINVDYEGNEIRPIIEKLIDTCTKKQLDHYPRLETFCG